MNARRDITMQDIADRLNIAKSTVSMALADKYGVGEDTRSEVILTAIEMGYDFSKSRISRRNTRGKVALVTGGIEHINSDLWLPIIKAIEIPLRENKIVIKLFLLTQYETIEDILLEINDFKPGGIICLACSDQGEVDWLSRLRLPIVLVDSMYYTGINFNHVRASNYACGMEAAKYLLQKGHRHLAFAGTDDFPYSFRQRQNGFRDYIEGKGGGKVILESMITPKTDIDGAMKKLLTGFAERPTAVFAANDYIALMVWYAAEGLGLKVPDDISLIGFDNVTAAEERGLTTFDVPRQKIGGRAASLMIELLENKVTGTEIIDIVSPLVERSSVSVPPVKNQGKK